MDYYYVRNNGTTPTNKEEGYDESCIIGGNVIRNRP
jgi:hypothetical protein